MTSRPLAPCWDKLWTLTDRFAPLLGKASIDKFLPPCWGKCGLTSFPLARVSLEWHVCPLVGWLTCYSIWLWLFSFVWISDPCGVSGYTHVIKCFCWANLHIKNFLLICKFTLFTVLLTTTIISPSLFTSKTNIHACQLLILVLSPNSTYFVL